MKLTSYLLPALALGGAAILVVPGEQAMGFTTIGGLLSINQRDFRIYNNFSDATANNNTQQVANFPGWDGAELAIWKGCIEWNSISHGDGSGDPTQGNLGDGGANFDAYFAGATTGIGADNDNIHSTVSSCSGGTLAYTETPISDGWRIRYCENWTWQDGPGNFSGGIDLQGVACHEYGHALGLGHSSTFSATMYPSISGNGVSARSIASDDINGIRSIYNVQNTSFKPVITGVSVSGNQVTITGTNFSQANGEVWFTNKNVTSPNADPRVRLTGIVATNGGTLIQATIPPDAGPGAILVRRTLTTNSSISNTFPFDGMGSGTPLVISSVTPSSLPNLIPGTAETVTISGAGFTPSTTIEIDGNPIAGSSSFFSSSSLTFEWEPLSLGGHTLTVRDNGQSDSTSITATANALPTLQAGSGDPLNVASGTVDLTMAGQPGGLAYVMVSPSNAPSILPGKLNLSIGGGFTSIFEVGLFVLDADGLATTTLPLTGISNTDLFWQSLEILLPLATNYPLQESNLQSTHTP